MVTGQAIGAHFSLVVTGDAPAHRQIDRRAHLGNLAILDIAMALLALKLAYRDMPAMGEVHVTGHLVDPMPRDLLSVLYIRADLFGLLAGTDFRPMASRTYVKARQARKFRLLHILVAEVALQAALGVRLMIELDRLGNRGARATGADRNQTHEHQNEGSVPP